MAKNQSIPFTGPTSIENVDFLFNLRVDQSLKDMIPKGLPEDHTVDESSDQKREGKATSLMFGQQNGTLYDLVVELLNGHGFGFSWVVPNNVGKFPMLRVMITNQSHRWLQEKNERTPLTPEQAAAVERLLLARWGKIGVTLIENPPESDRRNLLVFDTIKFKGNSHSGNTPEFTMTLDENDMLVQKWL